jgi:hypothetical protein
MYVYLRQGAQSGEYWGRQRFQFVVVKANLPVGRRDETVNRAHVQKVTKSNARNMHLKYY